MLQIEICPIFFVFPLAQCLHMQLQRVSGIFQRIVKRSVYFVAFLFCLLVRLALCILQILTEMGN